MVHFTNQIKINEQWAGVEYNEAIKIESWWWSLYNIHATTIVNVILQLKYWPFYPHHTLLYDKIVNTKLLLPHNAARKQKEEENSSIKYIF